MRLFSIPYAGGNAWSYRALERVVSPGISLVGLELPGRGRRGQEPLCSSLDELADDVFTQLKSRALHERYAIYGHSMGALLAFAATHRIRQAGLPAPAALFLSGSSAPALLPERRRHLLPKAEFIVMLRELGGCPPQVLDDAEMLDFFEPILRSDFKAVETWQAPAATPLDVPFVVMAGDSDESPVADAAAWAAETTAACTLLEFSGDHFFILRHWEAIGSAIQRQLFGAAAACQ
jgi:surfactin synthase thioesterase subunit